jgi:hypothetical protein
MRKGIGPLAMLPLRRDRPEKGFSQETGTEVITSSCSPSDNLLLILHERH